LTRARICVVVSPLTPALITRADEPFACSMAWSCAGNESDVGRPYPAVALAPSATICAEQQCIVAKQAMTAIRMVQGTRLMRMRPVSV
jgi:hypothetical protein